MNVRSATTIVYLHVSVVVGFFFLWFYINTFEHKAFFHYLVEGQSEIVVKDHV